MRRSVLFLLAAALLTVTVVVGGVVLRGGDEPEEPPEPEPFETTALADVDTTAAVVVRAPFCEAVDEREVAAALGAEPVESLAWTNGDRIDLGGGADVAHEYGCRYAAADGTVAQGWVFAPPVEAATAERWVRSGGKAADCVTGAGPAFGSPTLALTCTQDGAERASYRGLFGDAWVVCEVTRPAGATWDTTDRAGRWCAGLIRSVSPEANA